MANNGAILYKKASSIGELKQIIELQQKNLITQISNEEKKREGFVTASHSMEILKEMNDVCPHTLALYNNKVIGYALSMHPIFSTTLKVLEPMFKEIDRVFPKENKYISMGQICIEKNYRGQGVFRNLYKKMKENIFPEFDYIITGVDEKNTRSLNAHYATGFKDLSTISSGGQTWKIIVLK
ncbi:ribosomal protein S18 acetylase RimI-like enzyme [Saonia flava]|uniref:Ribosomal protein S18 acetylase RimI-like enzyme n=1 Tax=Saonia flava TaxID=523696 RepID=A0A846QT23_9FLAO|nr:GNAT family N-acetyltransferase [Saonia flava]NJB71208.1 ribosomal protein S18 acetylase RimI-like enzyme [Saonia flava]